MSYGTILVHLEFGVSPDPRLQYATDMAGDLDAALIGFASAPSSCKPAESGAGAITEHRNHFSALRRAFYDIAGSGQLSGWRQANGPSTQSLVSAARIADLIISGNPGYQLQSDGGSDPIDIEGLVLSAGRPVLLVADEAVYRHPDCAVICWRDTAQTRRAVAFAIPFLALARNTIVVSIEEGDGVGCACPNDVVRYLARHGISAALKPVEENDLPESFIEAALSCGADLVVAGAYARDHAFHDLTKSLVARSDLNRLMAG